MYSALFEAGHAAKDKEEPSWSVLAASLQETRFISGCARLNFLTAAIGTSSRDEAMPLAIALKSHPLLQVILMFNQDRVRDGPAFRQMISNLFDAQLDYRAGWLLNWLHRVDDQQAKLWYGQTMSRTCSTYQDRVRHSFMLTSQNVIPGPLNLYITVSPHSAYSHAKYVTNPKSTLPRTSAYGLTVAGADLSELPKIETRFSWSAVVQRSLAERYITEGKKVDSERCLSRLANLSADARTYRNLADMYLKQKKFDQWEESLLKSLEWGDLGLEHSRARVDLAEYYLKKKDVAKAATYAEEAASSGASWALLCLAECRAEQGQFDEADKLYEANDARYGAPFSWYFACRKYGKMDSKRAEARCEQVIGRLGEEMPNSLQLPLARYYLLKNELAKSRRLFLSNNVNNPAHVNRLFAGLVALAEGNAEEASSILFAASNTGRSRGRISSARNSNSCSPTPASSPTLPRS